LGELKRADYVLSLRREKNQSEVPKFFFERRCLFFAGEEGHELFQARVRSKTTKSPYPWAPVFDGEIKGPWTKYTTVWRVARQMPSGRYLDESLDNFFFW